MLAGVALALLAARPACAQDQPIELDDDRMQILTDPEQVKKKVAADRVKPPFEFYRSRVAPFDVLPYVKANHWATLALEVQANEADYTGELRAGLGLLREMPHAVDYRRDARLLMGRRARLVYQAFFSDIPKETLVDLAQPDAQRFDASWQASLLNLPPHQMLIVVLARTGSLLGNLTHLAAITPSTVDLEAVDIDRFRYYRPVVPTETESLFLSPHPLTWSTTSHVIWDALAPDLLSVSQQQAMLDWIHWGGQLILVGGAGQSFALFRESFLGPYLPGDPTGETIKLTPRDLDALAREYPPPFHAERLKKQLQAEGQTLRHEVIIERLRIGYDAPAKIPADEKKAIYLVGLKPRDGAAAITIRGSEGRVIAVEQRVGRGRITMLALDPGDPTLVAWPGLDTFYRRVMLRRPEEPRPSEKGERDAPPGFLFSQDLSWYRVASRDIGRDSILAHRTERFGIRGRLEEEAARRLAALPSAAEWRDDAPFPMACREVLEQSSGISIPGSRFVLQIVLAYLIVVIPLNWIICRFVFRRPEWTWAFVPVIAIVFAIAVERIAARNLGFESAADEIDLLEIESAYPRAHLSRIVAIYSSGRTEFSIAYPDEATALALPLNMGRPIRGEEIARSSWFSFPVPRLASFGVQPRSQSMFRAEQMLPLAGGVRLEGEGDEQTIVNESGVELRDAVLITYPGNFERSETYLGSIAAGGTRRMGQDYGPAPESLTTDAGFDASAVWETVRGYHEETAENQGESVLLAWTPGSPRGQVIDPPVDRHRGLTLVLVHLKRPAPPAPGTPRYNLLAALAQATESTSPSKPPLETPGKP